MQATIDISFYPLNNTFKPLIKDFIARLEAFAEIIVLKGSMSTQISGDYRYIMDILVNEMEKSLELHKAVFVIKVISTEKEK